ncbi:MAG: CatB-related O-acetyltransferase [Sedimentitalea sp.]
MSHAPKLPDPDAPYPVVLPDGSMHRKTVFLKNVIDHARIDIGAYTYASDFAEISDWAAHLAPYLFEHSAERLVIGKFGQIAHGARFVTASANHPMAGISTFPFSIFDPETMGDYTDLALLQGDTVVGHDVWIGYGATILPGVTIGSGAIIGARTVVSRDVAPYTVVAGNPARVVRQRFSPDQARELCDLAWWDWPAAHIAQHRDAIEAGDIDHLFARRP